MLCYVMLSRADADRSRADAERMKMELELLRARAELGNETRQFNSDHAVGSKMSLPNQSESEDIAAFFQSFEKVCRLQNIAEDRWATLIPSLFNANTRAAYNRLNYDDCCVYRILKDKLLKSSRLNAKHYLSVFNAMHRSGKENYNSFLNRLRDVQRFYLDSKEIRDFEGLCEDILLERFKDSLEEKCRVFVESRTPRTPQAAAEFADLYFEIMKPSERPSGVGSSSKFKVPNDKVTPQGKESVEPGAHQKGNNLKFHEKRGKFRSANSVSNNKKNRNERTSKSHQLCVLWVWQPNTQVKKLSYVGQQKIGPSEFFE